MVAATVIRSFVKRSVNKSVSLVQQLRTRLLSNDASADGFLVHKQVIVGMGGIGKTSTAKWYANEYEKDYDYIVWLDSEGSSLRSSLELLARKLNISLLPGNTLQQMASEVYEKFSGATTLFIFDNAECYGGLQNVLPTNQGHHMLITSRNHDWGNDHEFGQIETLKLGVFSAAESVSLLTSTLSAVGKRGNEEDLLSLATELGFLPLAIQCAVSTIKKATRHTVASYLTDIKRNIKKLVDRGKILNEYERSIYATMQHSLLQIENDDGIDEDIRECCKTILNISAYCLPDSILECMFHELPNVSKEIVSDALDQLEIYSLVLIEISSKNQPFDREFGMHRLMQHVVRLKLLTDAGHEESVCVARLTLETMRTAKAKFPFMPLDLHIQHAWSTMSECPELDEIQLPCIKYLYEISVGMNCNDFVRTAITNMRRVYNDWDLPLIQIKLILICGLVLNASPQTLEEARRCFKDLVSSVCKANIVWKPLFLLHLRIRGVELKAWILEWPSQGALSEQIKFIEFYNNVLDEMQGPGYDGIVDKFRLGNPNYLEDTSSLALNVKLWVLLNEIDIMCKSGRSTEALETLKREISVSGTMWDLQLVCEIVSFLIDEDHWNPETVKAIPLLTRILNAKLMLGAMAPYCSLKSTRFAPFVHNYAKTICMDFSWSSKHLLRMSPIEALDSIVDILTFLISALEWSCDGRPIAEAIEVVMEVINKVSDYLMNDWLAGRKTEYSRSLACFIDKYWASWVRESMQVPTVTRFNKETAELCLSRLLALAETYSCVLIAAGRGTEVPEVCAAMSVIVTLIENTSNWDSMCLKLLNRTNEPKRRLFVAKLVDRNDSLTTAEKKHILDGKLKLTLQIIRISAKYGNGAHAWQTTRLESVLLFYDDACCIHMSLGQLKEFVELWNESMKLAMQCDEITLDIVVRIGENTFTLFETRQDNLFKETMQECMTTLVACVQQLLVNYGHNTIALQLANQFLSSNRRVGLLSKGVHEIETFINSISHAHASTNDTLISVSEQ